MSASTPSQRVTRAPNGCNAKPIWLALTAEERALIEQLAHDDHRSLSAMARLLVLKGLEAAGHRLH